jgi:hypothetical protein
MLRLGLLAIAIALLALALGCSDEDDPVTPKEIVYDSPSGNWTVTYSNANVVINNDNLPALLKPFAAEFINQVIGGSEPSEWRITKYTVAMVSTLDVREPPLCAPMIYPYDEDTRTSSGTLLVQLDNVDVSALDLCVTVITDESCVSEVDLDLTISPDYQWADDYKTFSGTLAIGSSQNYATVNVTIVGPGAGTYLLPFYGTWDLSGSRCAGCTPCQ